MRKLPYNIIDVAVQLGNVNFNIPKTTLDQAAANDEDTSILANKMKDVIIPSTSSYTPLNEVPVMEFKLMSGGKELTVFDEPVRVSMQVPDGIIEKYGTEAVQNISAYLFNEDRKEWICVGGIYDPITKTVSFDRYHFSIYTLAMPKGTVKSVVKHKAESQVNFLYNKGIILISDAESFKPDEQITRGQFALYLAKALELNMDKSDAIEALLKAKMLTKAEASKPNVIATREYIAGVMSNVLKVKGNKMPARSKHESILSIYTDANAFSNDLRFRIAHVTRLGIMIYDDTFDKDKAMTYADVCIVIYNYLTKFK